MDVWQWILYGAASLLAVRSLVMLMTHHKAYYRRQLITQYQQQRRAKRTRAKAAPKADDAGQQSETAA